MAKENGLDQNTANQNEQPQDEGLWLIIPPPVLADESLPAGAKMVYGRVFGLTKKYGYCNASSEYIGRHINYKRDSVQRYLATLYEKGYLRYEIVSRDDGFTERRIYANLTPKPASGARGRKGGTIIITGGGMIIITGGWDYYHTKVSKIVIKIKCKF